MRPRQENYRKKHLSKSDYLSGIQCPKQLWLKVNEPNSVELQTSEQQEALFEQGRKVGELARTYVPGGTLIDFPYYALDEKIRATKRALEAGCPIVYEASFIFEKQFVAVDILERTANGFVATEVKSSTKVKPEHLEELALQAYVLQQNGLDVLRLQLMHINRECIYPNLNNLFVTEDVTAEVTPLLQLVGEQLKAQAEVVRGPLPIVDIGPHCSSLYGCPFENRCWANVPEHHVSTLYRIPSRKAFELVDQGFRTIQEVPVDFRLSEIAERQRRAVFKNRLIVEPTLSEALNQLPESIGFLDFETVGLAIPIWEGCRPYDAVPVQFSFCKFDTNGELQYSQWLAEGSGDPREEIASALIEACRGVETIAAYNASFELKCIQHLVSRLPHLAADLEEISSRIVDLLPLVRNHIYHPKFYGNFGLKTVFPALTGNDVYEDLEVSDGNSASWLLQTLLFESEQMADEEKLLLREELLHYCQVDTQSLAILLLTLREMTQPMVPDQELTGVWGHLNHSNGIVGIKSTS